VTCERITLTTRPNYTYYMHINGNRVASANGYVPVMMRAVSDSMLPRTHRTRSVCTCASLSQAIGCMVDQAGVASRDSRNDTAMRYNTIQYNTVQYSAVQCSAVQYRTRQYKTVQYRTVLYSTVQYNTI